MAMRQLSASEVDGKSIGYLPTFIVNAAWLLLLFPGIYILSMIHAGLLMRY